MAKKNQNRVLKKPEWGFQEWETAQEFQRFMIYRDMGPGRTYSEAAIQCGYMNKKTGKATSSGSVIFSNLAKKNKWEERIAAMLEHQQKEIMEEEKKEKLLHKRKVRKRLNALSDALFKPLETYIKRVNNGSLNFDNIDPKTFYDMLCGLTNKIAILEDLRMKIDGEPTNIHQVDGELKNKIKVEIVHSNYEQEEDSE